MTEEACLNVLRFTPGEESVFDRYSLFKATVNEKKSYAEPFKRIRKNKDVLSVINYAVNENQRDLLVLAKKDASTPYEDGIAFVRVPKTANSPVFLASIPRLLLRALSRISTTSDIQEEHVIDGKIYKAVNFYTEKIGQKKQVVTAVSVDFNGLDENYNVLDTPYASINVTTFTQPNEVFEKDQSKPLYYFDPENMSLMKKEKPGPHVGFIIKSARDRSSVPALLAIDDIHEFNRTKISVLASVIEDFNLHFSEIMRVDLATQEMERIETRSPRENDFLLADRSRDARQIINGFRIVDHVRDEKSDLIIKRFKAHVENHMGPNVFDEKENPFLIHLIMPKEHYKNKRDNDPYKGIDRFSHCVTPAVVSFDNKKKEDVVVDAVLQATLSDIITKAEICSGRLLNPVDLPDFTASCNVYADGNKKKKEIIGGLSVSHKKGLLEFSEVHPDDYCNLTEDEVRAVNFRDLVIDLCGVRIKLEETPIITFPHPNKIKEKLLAMDDGADPDIRAYPAKEVKEFLKKNGYDAKDFNEDGEGNLVSRKYMEKYFSQRRKDDKKFPAFKSLKFHLAKNGHAVFSNMRSGKNGTSVLSPVSGFYRFRENGDFYAVGSVGPIAKSYERFGSVVRFEADGEVPDVFWEMLKVPWVRNKQLTKLPFIFKHLREHFKMSV